jgi:hypothetical protein
MLLEPMNYQMAFIECSINTGHLSKFCEAAIHLKNHLVKIWPETNEIDVFPVFKP